MTGIGNDSELNEDLNFRLKDMASKKDTENIEDPTKVVEQASHTEPSSSGMTDVSETPANSVRGTKSFSLFKVGGIGLIATHFLLVTHTTQRLGVTNSIANT